MSNSDPLSPPGGNAPVRKATWIWHPPLPIGNSPIFSWPPNTVDSVKWLAGKWSPFSDRVLLVLLSVVTWVYLQPSLERCVNFEASWITEIYLRNMGFMILVAGGLHLYFYTFKMQGTERRFDPKEQCKDDPRFLFRDQVWDNVFWTCVSGVTIWSTFEVLFMWAYANGLIPFLEWRENPVWFTLWFLVIPIWNSFHFYFVHRFLHWKPLYKLAHSLHHRNINTGPWSGFSMHPIEHVIFVSSCLIHWLLASHPIHVIFHLQYLALTAATGHTGYEGVLVRGKTRMALGLFHHQLHHRYFECNYGNAELPLDVWFGTFHDGAPEATKALRQRQRTGKRASA